MRFLISGITGQLGCDCALESFYKGHDVIGTSTKNMKSVKGITTVQMNVGDPSSFTITRNLHPDAIIHCAAWTNVDGAEDNGPTVDAVNHLGTLYLAKAAKAIDAKMVYISTDYVFDGQGTEPWKPDDKNFSPLNVYGQSKLDGELAVASALDKFFIVRTSWVFGLNGNNFVNTIVNAGRKHDMVRVVNDQIGRPTYTKDLARLLVDMVETDKYGYYHVTNEGDNISWYDFTKEIFRQVGLSTTIIPVSTSEYGLSKAKRPFNSRLDTSKLVESGFKPLPDWKDALSRYLAEAKL